MQKNNNVIFFYPILGKNWIYTKGGKKITPCQKNNIMSNYRSANSAN